MVIKKPYAFLIKNFRLIHGLLFILLVFLTVKTFNIYSFFSAYAQNHVYINESNMANNYVSLGMYLGALAAVLISAVIYFILSVKNKSNKMYLASVLYYIVLLIFYIYIRAVFVELQTKALDVESVRAIRDICVIVMLPQIVFMFVILGRTLGFNLKQFDFKRDLEELEIDTTDNEEVEVTIGSDTYKIARFFRKALRLTKYFILENKLFVIGTASLIVIGSVVYAYTKLNVYKESYNESQNIQATSLWFTVNESYTTDSDLNNLVLNEGKYYVIVNVSISNKFSTSYALSRDTFRLSINDELLLPIYSMSDKFMDIGETFTPFEIKPGEDKECIVVFEINSSDLEKEYIFKVKNFDTKAHIGSDTQYKDIIIRPKSLNDNKDMGVMELPINIDLNDSILKNSSVNIKSVEFGDKFKEKYTYTIDGKEHQAIYSIIPSSRGQVVILKIAASMKIDDSIYMKKHIKIPADLFEYYGVIRFRYQGNYKSVKLKKINVDYNVDNYSYMEIPKEVLNANKIELIILIRGVKYTINLK